MSGIEQKCPQSQADLRRARLVRRHHVVALVAEPDCEQPGLRGLARAFTALKGQEDARPTYRLRARTLRDRLVGRGFPESCPTSSFAMAVHAFLPVRPE